MGFIDVNNDFAGEVNFVPVLYFVKEGILFVWGVLTGFLTVFYLNLRVMLVVSLS